MLGRRNYLKPRLDLLDQVLIRSATGLPPEDVEWEFGSLWQIGEVEQAEDA